MSEKISLDSSVFFHKNYSIKRTKGTVREG